MAWLELGGEVGTFWMGPTDRCAVLRNPNGVVCGNRLEGLAAADGLRGPTGLEVEIVGLALGQLVRTGLRQQRDPRFGAVPFL